MMAFVAVFCLYGFAFLMLLALVALVGSAMLAKKRIGKARVLLMLALIAASFLLATGILVHKAVLICSRAWHWGGEAVASAATYADSDRNSIRVDDALTKCFGVTMDLNAKNPDTYFEIHFGSMMRGVHDVKAFVDAMPFLRDHAHFLYFKCEPEDIDKIMEMKGLRQVDGDGASFYEGLTSPSWWRPESLGGVMVYRYVDTKQEYSWTLYTDRAKKEAYFLEFTW